MERMNISIPNDLREMMDSFDDINWSQLARMAFKDEIDRRKKILAINDSVARRLEETALEDTAKAVKEGEYAGIEWATHHARKVELQRLMNYAHSVDLETTPNQIAMIISKNAISHWVDIPNIGNSPDEFEIGMGWICGFVRGAVMVFENAQRTIQTHAASPLL